MKTALTTLVVAIGLLLVGTAGAQDGCQGVGQGCGTPACGHSCAVCCPRKVCKVVCEMKKVTTHCWCVECEEFCAPLPRLSIGWCSACGGCGDCGNCRSPGWENLLGGLGTRPNPIVPPRCGKVRVRKKLVKKEITREIPVYKCIVVECCEAGAGSGGPAGAGYASPAAGEPTKAAPQMAPIDEEAAPLPPGRTP
jgi:hypothetical protein